MDYNPISGVVDFNSWVRLFPFDVGLLDYFRSLLRRCSHANLTSTESSDIFQLWSSFEVCFVDDLLKALRDISVGGRFDHFLHGFGGVRDCECYLVLCAVHPCFVEAFHSCRWLLDDGPWGCGGLGIRPVLLEEVDDEVLLFVDGFDGRLMTAIVGLSVCVAVSVVLTRVVISGCCFQFWYISSMSIAMASLSSLARLVGFRKSVTAFSILLDRSFAAFAMREEVLIVACSEAFASVWLDARLAAPGVLPVFWTVISEVVSGVFFVLGTILAPRWCGCRWVKTSHPLFVVGAVQLQRLLWSRVFGAG